MVKSQGRFERRCHVKKKTKPLNVKDVVLRILQLVACNHCLTFGTTYAARTMR